MVWLLWQGRQQQQQQCMISQQLRLCQVRLGCLAPLLVFRMVFATQGWDQ
jgi:hypothetical protein